MKKINQIATKESKARAEDLFEQALDAPSTLKRIALTEKALEIYPGLPDAWCLLGDEKAKTYLQAISYFEKAIDTGRQDLGERFFQENVGHFWGMIESRGFMRAKSFLAEALLENGQIDESIVHYEDCLALNTNDNQGIRYKVLSLYLLKNRLDDFEKILKKYDGDSGAAWEFSKALFLYKKLGNESIEAARQLNFAKKTNKFVADYIVGKKKLPKFIPDQYQFGSKEEAQIYVGDGLIVWQLTPNAIDWVEEWN